MNERLEAAKAALRDELDFGSDEWTLEVAGCVLAAADEVLCGWIEETARREEQVKWEDPLSGYPAGYAAGMRAVIAALKGAGDE